MSQPTTAPVPSLAFSQEDGAVVNDELSKGFIMPKKEREAPHFFRRKSQCSIYEQREVSFASPSAVGILAGSKENMERWLRESGPGSSSLWAEAEDCSQNPWVKGLSRQLKLVYRLHSEKSSVFLPVLNGSMVEMTSLRDFGSLRQVHNMKKGLKGEVKRCSFTLEPELRSPSNVSSNSTGDMSPSVDTSIRHVEHDKSVRLAIPEKAYKRLVLMVSLGGIIREFQEFLRKAVINSNFLDVDFRLLNIHMWLKHHPFAAFLEGSDVLVVRRGVGLSGLRWVVLRFDFGEGLVKSTIGEDFDDLELVFGNNSTSQICGVRGSWWGQNFVSCGDKAQDKHLGNHASNLDWMTWTVPVENGDSCGGPLARLLLDALGSEDVISIAEANSLKSLFGSPKHVHCQSPTTGKDIETTLGFGKSKSMSWKEQCALSQLRSSSEELKGKGLHVLLSLLLGWGEKKSPGAGPALLGSLNGSVAGVNACLLEEGTIQAGLQGEDSPPLHIVNWLNCGFLEVLLGTVVKGGDGKDEGMESRVLSVEVAVGAFLRILELIPKEGSSQLATLLVASVRETCDDFIKLNIKHNRGFELNVHKRGHGRGTDERPCKSREIEHPKTKHPNKDLQDMFEKVLRFFKLLFLLASQSPLVGGPFAEFGGLDLILDLYFCLVKKFPTNLRFGVLSNASGACKNLEQILPGETLKSQDTPLKVLPCILPRACLSGVAQACLMDHCMTPKMEEVDFSWPPTSDWKVLYPFKNLQEDKNFNANEISHFPFESPEAKSGRTRDCDLMPLVKETKLHKSYPSARNVFTSELHIGCSNSSGAASIAANGSASPSTVKHNAKEDSQLKDSAVCHKSKQMRPFVPRLPLSSLRKSTSRLGTSLAESLEARALHTPSADPLLSQVSTNSGPSTSQFEILITVFNVKFELLHTLFWLLSNSSWSLHIASAKLLQKFQKVDEDYLALQFLPDIISSFLKTVPENTSRRMKKMLFEVISLLDKCKIRDVMKKAFSSPKNKMNEALAKPRKVSQGSPSSGPKRLADSLLFDIRERLRTLLRYLANLLATSHNLKVETASNSKRDCVTLGAFEYSDPLLENRTISSGHILNLWVDIALLLRALVDFVILWPERGSVQCVLNSCGKELQSVLGLLAEHSSESSWSLAQILTMEYLLKLLTVCMKSCLLEKRPEFQTWSEIDTFFWQLLFVNDLHWSCVKNFTTWVVVKSCQGCFRKQFEGYQKALWEPLEVYYNMLGQRINCKSVAEAEGCSFHGVDMSRCIFSFIRVSILMMKKGLQCQSQLARYCPARFMEGLLFLLDFLMNPVEGILMNVIRSQTHCVKTNSTRRGIDTANLLNSVNPPKNTGECGADSNREHTSVVIDDDLCSTNMQTNCRKCPSTPCAGTCSHKFLSYLKKESLGILADIFSLKSFDHHDEVTSLCVNPRVQNPFLFRRYVKPFLETIFFYFLTYYNKKTESSASSTISTFMQRNSGKSTRSVNRGPRFHDYTWAIDESSSHDTSFCRNDEDGVFCSDCIQDDRISSVACVTYGQVLRALAQNQTEDVNQSFQQSTVMRFLVQQISLEYEISQVATPRDTALLFGEKTTELLLQERQEAGNSIAGLLWTGERSKTILPQQTKDMDLLKAVVDDNDNPMHKMKAAIIGVAGKVFVSEESTVSALMMGKEPPPSLKNLQDSQTSLEHAKVCSYEFMADSSLYHNHHNFGFYSARDTSSVVGRRLRHKDSFVKLPSSGTRGILLPLRKEVVLNAAVLLGQKNDVNMFKKSSLTELEICNRQARSQRDNGVIDNSNKASEQSQENVLSSSIDMAESYTGPDRTAARNCLGMVSKLSAVGRTGDAPVENFQVQHTGERGEINVGAVFTDVRYTGRFFDLNEEVERELAQEGFPNAHNSCQQLDQPAQTARFDVLHDIQEESNLQDCGSQLTAFDPQESGNGSISKSSDSESLSELGPSIMSKQKLSHPTIPRLNLSKSVRKGGPTIKSDTSVDCEFLPSTNSTLDSKYRANAILELHRELQKEVVNSDRGSRSCEIEGSYETGCRQRRLYRHTGLHVLVLELFVSLMLTPQGTLETSYSDRYPMENRKLNAPFFLSYHLNHAANVHLLPCLSKRMKDFKPAAFRILKLTWRALFNPRIYTNRVHIARGAASQIYTAKMKQNCGKQEGVAGDLVVLKVVDVPKGPYEPCKFFDVYSEVEILEKFMGEPSICQILDYGVDTESFILVLKHYKCSLHTWRQGQSADSSSETFSPTEIQRLGVVPKLVMDRLPLYLEVYSAILQAVKKLEIENVVHYDLKCDNVLLEPLGSRCMESEFWTPRWPPADPFKPLPFRICIADFGQSKASTHLGGECTVRNRGTEYVKSPEMLKLLSSQFERDSDFNLRTTDEGVGKAVDVWSLGCLLYELLTGEYLFYDEDWLQFFMRVTLPSEELISKDKAAKLGNYAPVVDLLKFILVRDPLQRPSLDEVTICVEQLQLKLEAQALTASYNENEALMKRQQVSENSSDTQASDSDEQISSEIDNVPVRFEKKSHVMEYNISDRFKTKTRALECLECLRGLICHCQCGQE